MWFDYHVASFASTHSKTRQSDVIGCRQHRSRDHGSISTLLTKLLRKQWIITICPLVSDCTIGHYISFSYSTHFKSRQKMQSHSLHDRATFHLDSFHSKQDIVVGIFHIRNNHFLTSQMFFRLSCRFFVINTFENTPVGCNRMPRTQNTWPLFDIHIIDEVIKETVNNYHLFTCLRLYDRL